MKEVSAGGVVYKKEGDQIQLLIIEDRYSRISLPKGKIEDGETLEQTALREIKEETGVDGKIVDQLETIYYQYYHPVHGPIEKEVHYFLVEAQSDALQAQIEEINQVQWMVPSKAWELQASSGYNNNHSVIDKAFSSLNLKKG